MPIVTTKWSSVANSDANCCKVENAQFLSYIVSSQCIYEYVNKYYLLN